MCVYRYIYIYVHKHTYYRYFPPLPTPLPPSGRFPRPVPMSIELAEALSYRKRDFRHRRGDLPRLTRRSPPAHGGKESGMRKSSVKSWKNHTLPDLPVIHRSSLRMEYRWNIKQYQPPPSRNQTVVVDSIAVKSSESAQHIPGRLVKGQVMVRLHRAWDRHGCEDRHSQRLKVCWTAEMRQWFGWRERNHANNHKRMSI